MNINSIIDGLLGISENEKMIPRENVRLTLKSTIACLKTAIKELKEMIHDTALDEFAAKIKSPYEEMIKNGNEKPYIRELITWIDEAADELRINPRQESDILCDKIEDCAITTKMVNGINYLKQEKDIIPYGTKIIYHGENGWSNCKCYCGHYNEEDDTYNIYNGWDLCHVERDCIEVYDWT